MGATKHWLSFVLVAVAACGGKSKSPGTGPAPAKNAVPAPWDAVLVEGATFRLTDDTPQMPSEDPQIVVAKVHDVKTADGVTSAQITWTFEDGSDVMALLPTAVQVGPVGVWFANVNDDDAATVLAGPPTYPAGAAKTHVEGEYLTATPGDAGEICYGWEPDEDAGECEDVCFASVCIAPGKGIVSGEGNWWPGGTMYAQVAK